MPLRLNHDGQQPVSFSILMELEKINESTFRSMTSAFEPGGPLAHDTERPRAYGGHVYAQACWAAAQTVGKGFLVHSVTGFFTLPAASDLPFVYTVKTIRDGRSFCLRTVHVTQEETRGICFTCTCSFKLPERSLIDFQDRVDIGKEYVSVLGGIQPDDHPDAMSTEAPWFRRDAANISKAYPFPGLASKKVDMRAYNERRSAINRRQLYLYSAIGTLPPATENPNLHACAHMYASDRNSLFVVADHLGVKDCYSSMASLSHTVIFHTNGDALSMVDGSSKQQKWFVQEAWTDRANDGRGVHHSRLLDMDGKHVATTVQDGLVRLRFRNEEEEIRVKADLAGDRGPKL